MEVILFTKLFTKPPQKRNFVQNNYAKIQKNQAFMHVFLHKCLILVEATGLEPTTFWSLRHNRKFFIYFPSISKSFVSATNAFLYSCSHCFHVVQSRKWSNMWSFHLHVKNGCKKLKTTYPCTYSFVCRQYSIRLRKSQMLCRFSFCNPLKVQFCFSILHFKIALKKYMLFLPFTTQNLIRSKQRKRKMQKTSRFPHLFRRKISNSIPYAHSIFLF